MTNDTTLCAAGFSDSVVKIWSVTGDRLRSLKGSSEFSVNDFEHGMFFLGIFFHE
jgi:hypothetical protein